MIPHIINGNGTISLLIDGEMKPIDTAHPNYEKIKEAIKEQDWESIPKLVNVEESVKEYAGDTNITIENGTVLYKGTPVHNTLTERMLEMMSEGFDITYLVKFLDNLMENPSYRAVNELYGFLEAGNIPITENGTFLTYKKIRSNWTDIYTGKIDNSIGAVVEIPRNQVDEDSTRTCSFGLHVCSYDYLPNFGTSGEDRVVICEVNPQDVVAIPQDYNNTKMRVCKYKVIAEVEDYTEKDIFEDQVAVDTGDLNNCNGDEENPDRIEIEVILG